MELLGLFVVIALIYLLVAPIIAWATASNAKSQAQQALRTASLQAKTIDQLREEVAGLRAALEAGDARASARPAAPVADGVEQAAESSMAESTPVAEVLDDPPAVEPRIEQPPAEQSATSTPAEAPSADFDLPPPLVAETQSEARIEKPTEAADQVEAPAAALASETAAASDAAAAETPVEVGPPAPPPAPPPPREPSALELLLRKSFNAAKEWLFGGNLVAKIGLLILFIGVAFLLRFASSYVVVPIEVRLAGIAAGAIALLVWGWRIRTRRPGIALPAQGAALATLMLVSFGAFKLYSLIPAGATFALLLVLVAFTCLLAVLQNALWLAIFGIAGGFAVPILTSTGGGSHVALFSYYALLNAGVLAIALRRSWRVLNLIGFAFTFLIGTAWGVQEYKAEHYASSQFFLALFVLFYLAIAIIHAWKQAPKLKSYVDGTLVFGVPTVAMGLQYGMVKDFHLGAALSALGFGLLYAGVASALWRWRRGSLRLLVESFFALALVFGTLAIPLALDGRWTSAAWALEGAGIIWIGLRQRQAMVWRFGLLVQFGSWIAFFRSLTGIDAVAALGEHLWLGFAVLGATAVFLALHLRRHASSEQADGALVGWGKLASAFMIGAVVWILAGAWLEIWLRVSSEHRASLLVVSAMALIYALQWLARKAGWRLPALLAGAVTALTGVVFITLMARYMNWSNVHPANHQSLPDVLSNGALLGGALLSAAAWVSAIGFKQHALQSEDDELASSRSARYSGWWLWLALFWSSGFAVHGLAHLLSWVTGHAQEPAPWHAMAFWPAYAVLLAASAYGWALAARRWQLPNSTDLIHFAWPALTGVGLLLFLLHGADQLPGIRRAFDFDWAAPYPADGAILGFLGGPISGAAILAALFYLGLSRVRDEELLPELSNHQRSSSVMVWTIGLVLALAWPVLDALALFTSHALVNLNAVDENARVLLSFADARLLWLGLLAVAGLYWAAHKQRDELNWLALPAAFTQAVASAWLILALYADQQLPSPGTGIGMLGLWLAMVHGVSRLRQRDVLTTPTLQLAHFGRVIAPWLMLPALISLNLERWLGTNTAAGDEWIVAGIWPDYIAAWVAIALLLLGLRQVRRAGWPLVPLQRWYGAAVIPLAGLWGLLLAIYWNLRQDGSMQPLPYLPLLNPLDITSAFVALLWFDLWRMHGAALNQTQQRWALRAVMLLGFAWFNGMLLRTAAQYLEIPYRFEPLYESQFVQAMLSLVWTLCAFALMRFSLRRLSKPLWMAGAALLAVVVIKLFAVDLRNVGGVGRIVSFMGVGGLMLLIGYLAPLPRSPEAESKAEADAKPEQAS